MSLVIKTGGWLKPLVDWPQTLAHMLESSPNIVRIVLAASRGSAPREPGVGMLVGTDAIEGTIGGGQLEWRALSAAREMLGNPAMPAQRHKIVLAADVGQCCGGVVEVWIERYTRADLGLLDQAMRASRSGAAVLKTSITASGVERNVIVDGGADVTTDHLLGAPHLQRRPRIDHEANGRVTLTERLDDSLPPLWLYGAGHVGQALVRILMELPLRLTWVDSRADMLPDHIAPHVRILNIAHPLTSVKDAPPGTRFLVLTHSHALDFALCRAILMRGDFAWAGLIGSKSKAARFRARLARDGVHADCIARLVCPIGVGGIASKWPASIAVAVAAQLLQNMSANGDAIQRAAETDALPARCADAQCGTCSAA